MDIILNGAGGRMGAAIMELAGLREDISIAAAVDKNGGAEYSDINAYSGGADVIIDFSNHSATAALLKYACEKKLPAVIATTGHSEEEKELILAASKEIPLFYSANMSLGIAALCDFAKKAAALFPDADIEIVEAHHNQKLDSPSGTAQMLLGALCKVRPQAQPVYGRHGMEKRQKNEIGVHSLRMGSETGMHEVLISTQTQTLSLKHNAHSRAVFAEGALSAAQFLTGCGAGLYGMQDIIKI